MSDNLLKLSSAITIRIYDNHNQTTSAVELYVLKKGEK